MAPKINIKEQWQAASSAARTQDVARVMRMYFSRVDRHFTATQPRLDFKQVSSALHGTAKIWQSAQQNRDFLRAEQLIAQELQAFLQSMLAWLNLVLPRVDAQAVSNTLWAFAKLEKDSDALLPGIVNKLAQQFMGDIAHANGQEVANLMLACADLRLNPCSGKLIQAILQQLSSSDMTKLNSQDIANIANSLTRLPSAEPTSRLLDGLCLVFIKQLQSSAEQEGPNAQSIANFMHSMAKLPSAEPSNQLLQLACDRFSKLMLSGKAQERPNAQNLANVIYSLAILPSAQPSTQLLNAFCGWFLRLLQSEQPKAQDVANLAWALQQLKHVPSPVLGAAMLSRMLELCQVTGQQPNSQNISNLLLASAELRIELPKEQADALVSHLLAQDSLSVQVLANTAWGLAVSRVLQLGTFRQLLQRLHDSCSGSGPVTANLSQMHQALDWLAPPSGASSQHHKAWSELQTELRRLGPRPQPQKWLEGSQNLKAALLELRLDCNLGSVVKSYVLDAVVQPPGNAASPLLICFADADCFSNQPTRLTGRAAFRKALLSREGTLIEVPSQLVQQSVAKLAAYLRPRVKTVAACSPVIDHGGQAAS